MKHCRLHKLKRSPILPKGQANVGSPVVWSPEGWQRCDLCILGFPFFKYYVILEMSQSVGLNVVICQQILMIGTGGLHFKAGRIPPFY